MHKLLGLLKFLVRTISVSLLSLLAFGAIVILSVTLNITQPQTIKGWLDRSGFYNNAVDGLMILAQEGAKQSNDTNATTIEQMLGQNILSDEQVRTVLHQVVSPATLQEQTEGVIDGAYSWLNGSTDKLEFNFDLGSLSDTLIGSLTEQVKTKAKTLPVCTPQQLSQMNDPLSAGCLPPGVSATAFSQTFESELKKQDIPIDSLSFSASDFKLDPAIEDEAPAYYSTALNLPMLLSLAALGLILVIAFTDKTIIKGLKKSGQTLFLAGLFSWIGFFVLNRMGQNFNFPAIDVPAEFVDKLIKPIFSVVVGDIAQSGMWIASLVTISGMVLWLVPFVWQKTHPAKTAAVIPPANPSGDKQLPEPPKPEKSDKPDESSKPKTGIESEKDDKPQKTGKT